MNEFRNLDDVENELKKDSIDKLIDHKIGGRKTRGKIWNHRDFAEIKGILMIPAIVFVLIIVILFMEHAQSKKEAIKESIKAEESIKESINREIAEKSTEEETEKPDTNDLKLDKDLELETFFKEFFNARVDADADKLYAMTGIDNASPEQKEKLVKRLMAQAGYIDSYTDIKLYTAKALEENSKLVFVEYNVKFRHVDVSAPGIMYCYIIMSDGKYEILEKKSPKQLQFINDYIKTHEEAQSLIDTVNSKLLQLLSDNQRFAVLYDAFQTGRIYSEDEDKITQEVSIKETENIDKAKETAAPVKKEKKSGGNNTVVNKKTNKDVSKDEKKELNEESIEQQPNKDAVISDGPVGGSCESSDNLPGESSVEIIHVGE